MGKYGGSKGKGFQLCGAMYYSLGNDLEEGGYDEIRKEYSPLVHNVLAGVQPRVITGYATLLWFTSKVCILKIRCTEVVLYIKTLVPLLQETQIDL